MWLYQGHVLCGWHTHLACRELGIEPEYVEVEARNDNEAVLKALSVELRRRSYTEQQRCAVWFRAADKVPPLRGHLSGSLRGKRPPAVGPQAGEGGTGPFSLNLRPTGKRQRRLENFSVCRGGRRTGPAAVQALPKPTRSRGRRSQLRHANPPREHGSKD